MQALEGIKVIDFSKWLPGQYCGMVLGDFGAEVIKVEDLNGDVTRGFTPEMEPKMSYWHMMLNRNKKGVTVNLKTQAGIEVMRKLLSEADVFLEGFRPGYLATKGLDYETIKEINPRLVYCSISGFGQTGKYAHKPSHDLNVVGLSGIEAHEDGTEISVPSVQVAALGSGMNAVSGILMALMARERSGRGQFVDINLYSTAINTQLTGISSLLGCQKTGAKSFGRTASHYYDVYKTGDGRYMSVGTIEPKFWRKLCELLNLSHLADRQFEFDSCADIKAEIRAAFATKTQAEWLELIGTEEYCVTPVLTLKEALASELTIEQTNMLETKTEDIGEYTYVKPAVKLSDTPGLITRRAPYLGEHTEEVLGGIGYTKEEIAALREKGDV